MRFQTYLMCGAALLITACGTGNSANNDTPRTVKCESAKVADNSHKLVTLHGRVTPSVEVNIGFRVAGIIDEICAEDGKRVRKGEIIARLDKRDYALQLTATQAEADAIKAEAERVVALYAEESVSAKDHDKAASAIRAISAKIEAHKNALYDTDLRAPFDGYIQRHNFDKGEAVAAGSPVMVLISATPPEITVEIPAAQYIKQNLFKSAEAKIEIYGDEKFPLQLKGISPKANLNQLYKATFTVSKSHGELPLAGVSAVVEMSYANEGVAEVIIPFAAVVERDGASSVWVVSNNKVAARSVKVARVTNNGSAYISSGLTAGEVVVSAGVNSLKEGQLVSILKESSASNVGGLK